MNKYERLLRFLSKRNGGVSYTKDCRNRRLITVSIDGKEQIITNRMSNVLLVLKYDLREV